MLKKYYLDEWHFFKKQLLPVFIILLVLSVLLGYSVYLYGMENPHKAKTKLHSIHKKFEDSGLITRHGFKLMIGIFWNNLIVCLLSIILGFVPFLFISVMGILAISVPVGLALALNTSFIRIDTFSLLASLGPHGIFESIAVLYASSEGVYLTIQISKMILPKFRSKAVRPRTLCKHAACSFILVVVPLLMVAAFIEVYITPKPVLP